MRSVHKMVKHTLKILQQMLQGFWRVFYHFVDTGHYGVNIYLDRISETAMKLLFLTADKFPPFG